MATAEQVADAAQRWSQAGKYKRPGMCLQWCREMAGIPSLYPDAYTAWRNADNRHTGTAPRGAFGFWKGSGPYGHIAISAGGGRFWSTDLPRSGYVGLVSGAYITAKWGQQWLGWTNNVNGRTVSGLVAVSPPTVKLANLRPGLRNADVKDLQLALRRHGVATFTATSYYGDLTRAAVQKFQKAQGWSGADANGIPGPTTCKLLGLTVI